MRTTPLRPQRLLDYTSLPFEIFIVVFSLLPFLALAYFYPALPDRVPLFMSLNGEVAVWANKSLLSVFRVPLMAVDTQLICLLMKYGVVQSYGAAPVELPDGLAEYQKQSVRLNAGLWDWLRFLVAFKMSAASLDTIFLTLERFKFLSRPAFIVTAIAALLSVVGGVYYGYRLLALRRAFKGKRVDLNDRKPARGRHVYGGVLYFNPSDPAMLVRKYAFNFANKWAWVLILCVIAYPVLVFSTA